MLQQQSHSKTLNIWLVIAVIAGFFGIRVFYQHPPSESIAAYFITEFNFDAVMLMPLMASVLLLAAAIWGNRWFILLSVFAMLGVLFVYLQMFSGTITFVKLTMLPLFISSFLLLLNAFYNHRFSVKVKQSILLASILLTALLIPEVLFSIIDFRPEQMIEIRSFTIALFTGIFILSLFSSTRRMPYVN